MSKVIRLTESDLTRIVKRVMNEDGRESINLSEQILKNLIKTGAKSASKMSAKYGVPLLNQLPDKIRMFIKTLPTSVKIGPKLERVFKENYVSIKSLPNNFKHLGIDDLYARKLSEAVSKSRGTKINLQELYQDAQFVRLELENIKSTKSLYSVNSGVNRFIADLESIIPKKPSP